jgi:hypothetical protein
VADLYGLLLGLFDRFFVAARTGAKKFQAMGHIPKAMIERQKSRLIDGARLKSADLSTDATNHVVVVVGPPQLEPCWAVTKVTSVYDAELLERDHGAINRRWVHGHPFTLHHPFLQSFDGERTLLVGEKMNDRLAGSGKFEPLLFDERQCIHLQL